MTNKASERFSINWQAVIAIATVVSALALILALKPFSSGGKSHGPTGPTETTTPASSKPSAATAERARVQQEADKQKRAAEAGGWLSTIPNPNRNNINEVNSHPVTVGGRTYAHTVQLVQLNSNCNSPTDPSTVSFPVPSGATRLSGSFGWTSDSNGSSANLFVYADSTTNKPLWSQPFSNPGLPLMFKRLNTLAGAHAVIFELVGQQCDNGTFVLAEARFTA